jgi:hypothetical protein
MSENRTMREDLEDQLQAVAYGPWHPGIKAGRAMVASAIVRARIGVPPSTTRENDFWPVGDVHGGPGTDVD